MSNHVVDTNTLGGQTNIKVKEENEANNKHSTNSLSLLLDASVACQQESKWCCRQGKLRRGGSQLPPLSIRCALSKDMFGRNAPEGEGQSVWFWFCVCVQQKNLSKQCGGWWRVVRNTGVRNTGVFEKRAR